MQLEKSTFNGERRQITNLCKDLTFDRWDLSKYACNRKGLFLMGRERMRERERGERHLEYYYEGNGTAQSVLFGRNS